MKSKSIAIALVAGILLLTGCAQIPQAAIDVNKQVSTGITTIGDNGKEMVLAWENTAYSMLDERWERVYRKAESSYRTKKGILAGTALSSLQQEEVAGLAALVRDEVRGKIRLEADDMRKIIASNTKSTLEANESITQLLVSANAVNAIQQSAIKEVGPLLPIPPVISGFIESALAASGL